MRIADERGICEAGAAAAVLQNVLPIPVGAVAVELADGRRVSSAAASPTQKCAIVLETEQLGAIVSHVARTHGIVTSVLVRWRAELGFSKSKAANLDAVRITGNINSDASAEVMVKYAAPSSARRDRQQVAEWGSGAHSECQIFAP
jgi:transposase-like protein